MKILTIEEIKKAVEDNKAIGKSGSRKEAKKLVKEIINKARAEKIPAIRLEIEDINPYFQDGFTEGVLEEIAEDNKVKRLILPKNARVEIEKGEKIVPRFLFAEIEL